MVNIQKFVHIHIKKCGGNSAKKVFATDHNVVCSQGSSSYNGFEIEINFLFMSSKNMTRIWPYGFHPTCIRAYIKLRLMIEL